MKETFSDSYPNLSFKSTQEAAVFWKVMFDCDGGIFSLALSLYEKADKTPKTSFTKHENAFRLLYPNLKQQVTFGLGKGAYERYKVLKYTADFYDEENKVVYEIDGGSHNSKLQKLKDEKRDLIMMIEFGVKTVRFTNEEVERMILKRIREVNLVEQFFSWRRTETKCCCF